MDGDGGDEGEGWKMGLYLSSIAAVIKHINKLCPN